jgi:hypothetical protein
MPIAYPSGVQAGVQGGGKAGSLLATNPSLSERMPPSWRLREVCWVSFLSSESNLSCCAELL